MYQRAKPKAVFRGLKEIRLTAFAKAGAPAVKEGPA